MQFSLRCVLGVLFFISVCSCSSLTEKPVTEKAGAASLYTTESDDAEINTAISKARNSLSVFDSAFKSNRYDTSTFAIKVRFPTETGSAHIWVTGIELENGQYYGIMDDIPELTTVVKQGERIAINRLDISDWMFADNGILRGGYTIKMIRSRMGKTERDDFDKNFDFRIED